MFYQLNNSRQLCYLFTARHLRFVLFRLPVQGLEHPFVRHLHLPVELRAASVAHPLLLCVHRQGVEMRTCCSTNLFILVIRVYIYSTMYSINTYLRATCCRSRSSSTLHREGIEMRTSCVTNLYILLIHVYVIIYSTMYSINTHIFVLMFILYSYLFIVKTVIAHEAVMAAQAKKMNVGSLRSGVSE